MTKAELEIAHQKAVAHCQRLEAECRKLLDANKLAVDRAVELTQEVEYLQKLVESLRNPKPTGPKIERAKK